MTRHDQGWILAAFAERREMFRRVVQDHNVEDVWRAVGAADLGSDVLVVAVRYEFGR